MQFNPDGSLKISSATVQKKEQNENRMNTARCIKIHKEMVNFTAPKKCVLRLTLSKVLTDSRFVETIHHNFKNNVETPTKLIKINDKEFDIEIGTTYRRCSDCTKLVGLYREFMDGSFIEEKGNCTYEPNRNFCYEDYFE